MCAMYALLVGIDNYPPAVNPLAGCINDIRRFEQLLHERGNGDEVCFEQLVLTDAGATRQAMIDGFRTHLGQAGPSDVALFYYSGHGSQQPSPPEYWHLEPDHLDETLVCYDSRLPGKWDLADKELAQLVAEVAENGPHVVVILDCCHSGSGTREFQMPEEGVRIRRVPTDVRQRPFASFIVGQQQAAMFQPTARGGGQAGWYTLPSGRHVVLSACNSEEEAKELYLGGEQRGAFSYYLMDTLQRTGESLSYRDLFKRVNAQVRLQIAAQSPQMEATQTEDLGQPFLGGVIQPGSPYFTASFDRQRGWVIDGGAMHGIPAPSDGETTRLALFPTGAQAEAMHDLAGALGEATVTQVFPGQSAVQVTLASGADPDTETTYKGVVTSLPLPPMVVALEGDAAALTLLRNALASTGPERNPSLIVREGRKDEAQFYVQAEANRYRIRRKGDGYALVVDTEGFAEASAELVLQRLEHIARWTLIGRLQNATTKIPPGAVRVEIEVLDGQDTWQPTAEGSNVRLEYQYKGGAWCQPQFRIKLTNTTSLRLYCILLDLSETYGVLPFLPGGGIWLDAHQNTYANSGEPIYAEVQDPLWRAGVIEFNDTLKLIASTEESDATLLQQDDLPVSVQVRALRKAPAQMNTLNRLLYRVPTRGFSTRPAGAETLVDWVAAEVSFTTVRPLEAAQIPEAGKSVTLGYGVTVQGHSALKASARLSDLPLAGRDTGNLSLPALLRDHPDVFKPFEFTSSRSGEPGLSVLELVDVQSFEAVTPEEPLVLQIGRPLAKDESLLALGFDGEFYLPAGFARRLDDRTEVVLERLPAPTSRGTRDLKGAIRIYFQKVMGQRIGLDFPYPILAAADVANSGSVTYQPAADAVAAKVATAERTLLYVHGIIGDTRMLASSARTGWLGLASPPPGLVDHYDLLLTFDYESVNT